MIGFLSGIIHEKAEGHVIIDVNGVGYEVYLAKNALFEVGEEGDLIKLEIYTHYNESSFQLFGFLNLRQKNLFKKLISVSGVGPKLGLGILSGMEPAALITALVEGNIASLTNISGIGRKTAERLIIELKDKFKEEALSLRESKSKSDMPSDLRLHDALSALISLGYQDYNARKALQMIPVNPDDNVQAIIKKSLSVLAK